MRSRAAKALAVRPDQDSYKRIKEAVKQTWKDTGVPEKSGKKRDTESRLRVIGSKVRGWRNYHWYCNMGKHSLWFISHWLWKKLRKDKAKTKQKETLKLLSKKKAGTQAHRKASELKSLESFNDSTNVSQTPKACSGAAAPEQGCSKKDFNKRPNRYRFPKGRMEGKQTRNG